MKKLILTVALGVACASAYAQGVLNFANIATGVNAPVWEGAVNTGTKLAGSGYVAQLWAGAAGSTEGQLTAVGNTVAFLSGAQAGWFTGGARTITGVNGGETAVVQIRAWSLASGATWAEATANPLGVIGSSPLLNVVLTVAPTPPANLVGLQQFAIVPVPEPSTFALAGLGAAAMLIFRRRK